MKDVEKLVELRDKCITIGAFEYDNEFIVLGNIEAVILRYLDENPNKKFRTWLIDSKLVINQAESKATVNREHKKRYCDCGLSHYGCECEDICNECGGEIYK